MTLRTVCTEQPTSWAMGLWREPAGTGQHNLGTPQAEGIGGAPRRFQLQTFIIGQGSDIERWFHNPSVPWKLQLHKSFCGNALGRDCVEPAGR